MRLRNRIAILIAALVVIICAALSFRAVQKNRSPTLVRPGPSTPAASLSAETFILVADRSASVLRSSGQARRGDELDVGFRTFTTGTEAYQTALHFTVPADLREKGVQRATLKIFYRDAWGTFNNRTVTAHRITENWSEASVRFTIGRDSAFATNIVGGRDFGWVSWEATEAVRYWAAHPDENFGVLLVPDPTGLMDNSFRFASTRFADPAFHPVLEVTY